MLVYTYGLYLLVKYYKPAFHHKLIILAFAFQTKCLKICICLKIFIKSFQQSKYKN